MTLARAALRHLSLRGHIPPFCVGRAVAALGYPV